MRIGKIVRFENRLGIAVLLAGAALLCALPARGADEAQPLPKQLYKDTPGPVVRLTDVQEILKFNAAIQPKPITSRPDPDVGGIDRVQASSYVDAEGLELAWFYNNFTRTHTFYKRGSRPKLEAYLKDVLDAKLDDMAKLQAIHDIRCKIMPGHVLVGSLGTKDDRGASVEELMESGVGRCNETARAMVALCQVAGLPARMIFISQTTGKGHVAGHCVCEILAAGKWVLVDPSREFIFRRKDGTPVSLLDLKTDAACWDEVNELYRQHLVEMYKTKTRRHTTFTNKRPLELFCQIGYCNDILY